MNGDYQIVYDAGQRVFELQPVFAVLVGPIIVVAIIAFGKWRRGHMPGRLKLYLWGTYLLYTALVIYGYWSMWQDQSTALDPRGIQVVEGRLTDGWVRQKSRSQTTDIYQHFTVGGVEFLHKNRRRKIFDSLFPRPKIPPLPLHEGTQVRVTYRGEGPDRKLLKFEIPAD